MDRKSTSPNGLITLRFLRGSDMLASGSPLPDSRMNILLKISKLNALHRCLGSSHGINHRQPVDGTTGRQGSQTDHNLAEMAAALEVFERGRRLVETKHSIDDRLELVLRDERVHGLEVFARADVDTGHRSHATGE
jgi:hypothetical protein